MTIEIAFLDVGNADCIALRLPHNRAVIVDVPQPRYLHQWLRQWTIHHIESIYITHGHQDHWPALHHMVPFLADWFKQHNTVGALYLPNDVYEAISTRAPEAHRKKHKQREQERLEAALGWLGIWRQNKDLHIFRSEKSGQLHTHADLAIHILHPDAFFAANLRRKHRRRLNDLALVLRIDYGLFRVLLPSDIEREGLRDLLQQCTDEDLRCHILKIPHHGAWQQDATTTEKLLTRANPEVAILSVGSTNTYKHVQPGLFRSLIQLQQTHRLQRFICTEVTRTCRYTAQERAEMENRGLSARQHCAGNIVIMAEQSGEWSIRDQAVHEARVDTIERAACRGRADLADDDIAQQHYQTSGAS